MMRRGWCILLILGLLAAVAVLAPWRSLAERLLRQALASHGLTVAHFVIDGVGAEGVSFRDIELHAPYAVKVEKLALAVSWQAVRHGAWEQAVTHVTLHGLALDYAQDAKGATLNGQPLEGQSGGDWRADLWQGLARLGGVGGIDAKAVDLRWRLPQGQGHAVMDAHLSKDGEAHRLVVQLQGLAHAGDIGKLAAPQILATVTADPAAHAVELALAKSTLAWEKDQLRATLPLSATIRLPETTPANATLTLESAEMVLGQKPVKLSALTLKAKAAKSGFPWTLALAMQGLQWPDAPADVASVNADAVCTATAERLGCATINLSTPTKRVRAQGNLSLAYAAPDGAHWGLSAQVEKLYGGRALLNAKPLKTGFQPVAVAADVKGMRLQEVLSLLAEGKVQATGTVSGHIPLVWNGGQDITVGAGALRADGPGVLKLAPDVLAMDNPQVAMVSGILADFHYDTLTIALVPDKSGLQARLSLGGNNPAMIDGHPVKLNVNLTGDLLSLLKNSILPMSDPALWLSQSNAH